MTTSVKTSGERPLLMHSYVESMGVFEARPGVYQYHARTATVTQAGAFSKVTYDMRIQVSDLLHNAVYFDGEVSVSVRRPGLTQLLKDPSIDLAAAGRAEVRVSDRHALGWPETVGAWLTSGGVRAGTMMTCRAGALPCRGAPATSPSRAGGRTSTST